jgi:arylsulfatase A-like enzyme/chitodextrinase
MYTAHYKILKLVLPLAGSMLLTSQGEAQKNVLFLMADDINNWTSADGEHPGAQTPALDALAEKGVMFTNALCSSPVCNPSRNAFMSGYRPSTTGITRNQDGYVRDKPGFGNIVSMHQYFMENGYHTVGAGKLWHPGRMGDRITDPDNWSALITDPSGCNGGTYRRYDGSQYTWSGNTSAMNRNNCSDYNLALKIAELISGYHESEISDKPFFIGCGLFRPHAPFHSPKQFWDVLDESKMLPGPGVEDKYKTGSLGTDFHREVIRDGVWGDGIQSYLASIALTDHNIGIILDALDNSPMRHNTIVVFMGDHGFDLGEHGRWGKFAKTKSANHTTLIIYDPTAIGNGQKCHVPVSLQDIYPTLIELAGLPPKHDIEGVSLSHLLNCPTEENWPHPILMTYAGGHYIMHKNWYFIEDGNNSQLFNDDDDPYQWNNLYGNPAYISVVSTLRNKIDSIVAVGTAMRNDLLAYGKVQPENYSIPKPVDNSSCQCEDDIPPTTPGSASLIESWPTSLEITWEASTDNVAVAGYDVFLDGFFRKFVTDNHTLITDLQCETDYAIKIRTRDDCPNFSDFSDEVVFSTDECDTTPPTIPGDLHLVSVNETTFTVAWIASTDNIGVKGYEVFIDGVLKSITPDTVYTLSSLECSTTYEVTVRAFDHSSNYSDYTSVLPVSTSNCFAFAIPGIIQAEEYYQMSGVEVQAGQDTDSTDIITDIQTGNWVSYHMNVDAPGQYVLDFRVASGSQGGTIQVLIDDVLRSFFFVPGTGGWQNWTTVNHELSLDQGFQMITFKFLGTGGNLFNINWIDIKLHAVNTQLVFYPDIRYLISNVADEYGILHLDLLVSDPVVKLEVIDLTGRILHSDIVPGEHERWEYQLPRHIKPGIYFIRVNNHAYAAVEKFLVY